MALLKEEFTSLSDDVDLDRDRVLVERCQAGDSGAFGNLYARYYERLLRFCLRRLNDRHEAEDAAQEAFARAWKALPNFAGERRFYPWLTVIAGNICTDMLRRRSRSTPTDDLELGSHEHVGGGANETSEELVLAAVDGELVNRALGRLSVRHRHVLAMREGSGWTYQQIADHEGVEIGTIETLLWRARQALKREFTVLSESKGMLGGFLAGAGALLRRGFLRTAHRSTTLQPSGGAVDFAPPWPGWPSRRPQWLPRSSHLTPCQPAVRLVRPAQHRPSGHQGRIWPVRVRSPRPHVLRPGLPVRVPAATGGRHPPHRLPSRGPRRVRIQHQVRSQAGQGSAA